VHKGTGAAMLQLLWGGVLGVLTVIACHHMERAKTQECSGLELPVLLKGTNQTFYGCTVRQNVTAPYEMH
jgi:hypothetical protein